MPYRYLPGSRSEEHTSELQSLRHLVCRLLLEKKTESRQQTTAPPPACRTRRSTDPPLERASRHSRVGGVGGRHHRCAEASLCAFFFFNDTATTEIYTLSLHDALPIYWLEGSSFRTCCWASIPTSIGRDRKSTRLNSSHLGISYAVFCLKKKKHN